MSETEKNVRRLSALEVLKLAVTAALSLVSTTGGVFTSYEGNRVRGFYDSVFNNHQKKVSSDLPEGVRFDPNLGNGGIYVYDISDPEGFRQKLFQTIDRLNSTALSYCDNVGGCTLLINGNLVAEEFETLSNEEKLLISKTFHKVIIFRNAPEDVDLKQLRKDQELKIKQTIDDLFISSCLAGVSSLVFVLITLVLYRSRNINNKS